MQGRVRIATALAVEALAIGLLLASVSLRAEAASLPAVQDDSQVQQAVAAARKEFLGSQDFDRLTVTVLVEAQDHRWLRGSVGGDELAYPASCVKLAFLVGAVHWCAAQGKAPDCLDASVRPMIVDSDNVATGVVVDTITGAPNGPPEGADLGAFIERRRYTERLLEQSGLLGDQRIFTKTYPTNSGEEPGGLEYVAWKQVGRNMMSTNRMVQLMLAIQSGAIEPQARDYMRSLLRRPTFSNQGSLGGGLPPGTLHENKVGNAFDTLEDIVYAELPNGRRLIVAALSNGYSEVEADAEPWDVVRLNHLMELLVAKLDLAQGLPAPRHLQAVASSAGRFEWQLAAPEGGTYEVAAWYSQDAAATPAAEYALVHADGTLTTQLDQRMWGSRWIKLGDVRLTRGSGSVSVSSSEPGRLDPGRLRITRWSDPPTVPSGEAPTD